MTVGGSKDGDEVSELCGWENLIAIMAFLKRRPIAGMKLGLPHEECLSRVQKLNCGWTNYKIRATSGRRACFNVGKRAVVVGMLLFRGPREGLTELLILD